MSSDKRSGRRGGKNQYSRTMKGKGRKRRSRRNQRTSKKYKADLEKLFESGGDVPERFQEVMKDLGPEEGSPEAERRQAVDELRQADDFRAFVKAVSAYQRKGYELPDDEELLGRMLEHPRESIVLDVLNHLIDLHRRRTLKGSASLNARLKSVKTVSDDPRVHELADEVLQALG